MKREAHLLPDSSVFQTPSGWSPGRAWPEAPPTFPVSPWPLNPQTEPPDAPGNPGNDHHKSTRALTEGGQLVRTCRVEIKEKRIIQCSAETHVLNGSYVKEESLTCRPPRCSETFLDIWGRVERMTCKQWERCRWVRSRRPSAQIDSPSTPWWPRFLERTDRTGECPGCLWPPGSLRTQTSVQRRWGGSVAVIERQSYRNKPY